MKTRIKIALASLLLIMVYFFGELTPGETGIDSIISIEDSYYQESKDRFVAYVLALIPVFLPLSVLFSIFGITVRRFFVVRIIAVLMLCYFCFLFAVSNANNTETGDGLLMLIVLNLICAYYTFRIKKEDIGEPIL